ncbi:transposase [Amedibacillus sp. YH-ame6]
MIEKDIFLDNEPVYNKHFKKKLNKRDLLDMILNISENLTLGYRLKEMYLKFNKEATENDCEQWFDSILNAFVQANLSEYYGFIITLKNWRTEILNSFKRPIDGRKLSNALSENINGQIRTYLSVSNGVSNFVRFRKRCIFSLNPKVFYSITDQLRSDKITKKHKK